MGVMAEIRGALAGLAIIGFALLIALIVSRLQSPMAETVFKWFFISLALVVMIAPVVLAVIGEEKYTRWEEKFTRWQDSRKRRRHSK